VLIKYYFLYNIKNILTHKMIRILTQYIFNKVEEMKWILVIFDVCYSLIKSIVAQRMYVK